MRKKMHKVIVATITAMVVITLIVLPKSVYIVFLLSRPVCKQLLDIVREQVLLISCFAADSPLKYQ